HTIPEARRGRRPCAACGGRPTSAGRTSTRRDRTAARREERAATESAPSGAPQEAPRAARTARDPTPACACTASKKAGARRFFCLPPVTTEIAMGLLGRFWHYSIDTYG